MEAPERGRQLLVVGTVEGDRDGMLEGDCVGLTEGFEEGAEVGGKAKIIAAP